MSTKRKKSIKSNVKAGWKTTVLGIIIILATVISIFFVPGITWWPEGFIGISLGVVLWFSPDTIIDLITRFIGGTNSKVITHSGKKDPVDDIDDDDINIPTDQLKEP